ncbi:MAG: putative Ser/Thr protein kinase [Kiritimatiellia bacterium]|jgi:predicted Ser/Thr protein kinase
MGNKWHGPRPRGGTGLLVFAIMALTPPSDLGPYQHKRLLSSGAQAQIWLCDGPDGEAAVKVARGPEHQESLLREAELLRDGPSHGLVRLLDFEPSGKWLTMERIRGQLIDAWSYTRSQVEIIEVVTRLLSILHQLHQQGVIHADIKPSNVMIDEDGNPRLLDLGVATVTGERVKGFRGTLGYAAPEVLQGNNPTPRSDLYGVGAVLYRCLTGNDPFPTPDPAALAYLPMVTLPAPPSTFQPGITRLLENVVLTMLSRDASRRPSSADRARELLAKSATGPPARWVLGMSAERDELRQAVVGAADGEPRVVVVYGPPGSGRRTLIAEASDAARRLGLQSARLTDLSDGSLTKVLAGGQSVVVVARARQQRAIEVARTFIKGKLPGLVLLHSERPVPSLTDSAIQITPPPLGQADVARVARHLNVDPQVAEDAWAQWAGHPGAVMGALRAASADFDPKDLGHLPSEARQLLTKLEEHGECTVLDLAGRFRIDPHTLLDHCSVLLAEGRVVVTQEGTALALA